MAEITESQFKLPDGAEVYQKTWAVRLSHSAPSWLTQVPQPHSPPVAKLLFIHGNSDHVNRYYELFPRLAGRGVLCTGIDQRGWGRSTKRASDRGNTGPTDVILRDISSFVAAALPSTVPVFLMGHSMGGALVMTLASRPEYAALTSQLRGILLESPYVALVPRNQPATATVAVGRLVGRMLPLHQLHRPLPLETVVRDPEVQASVRADELCHNIGTLQMFSNMLDRAAALDAGRCKLNPLRSLWLAHGTGDEVTSYEASRRWFERDATAVRDREFKSYDGWSHQLHADSVENRAIFAKDVGDWILARCDEGPESKL
jgi:acylglycerol lipase